MTHYYDEHQSSQNEPQEILVQLNADSFFVETDNGLFSKDHLDTATELLIETVTPEESVLDLGCGYGVIGIAYLRQNTGLDAAFVDTNKRALKYTRRNLDRNDVQGIVKQSNAYDNVDASFTDIVSNPPLAAGKDTWHEFIEGAPDHLTVDGRLSLVAPHNKGGKSVKQKMQDVFGNVEELDKASGFRVYQSTR